MAKYTNEEYQNMKYRQVEAMYRKGLSIEEIMRCSGLTNLSVLDLTCGRLGSGNRAFSFCPREICNGYYETKTYILKEELKNERNSKGCINKYEYTASVR